MEEEYISFKWAGHDNHLNYLLYNICNKEIFSDATLACDGCLFPVHKLVLAACSDYFCEIFDKVSCKCPVIVLKDTRGKDLMALLEYMYLGKVSLKNADLNPFLQAAESLRIKGLAVSDSFTNPLPVSSNKSEASFKSSRKQKPRKSLSGKVNGIDKNLNDPLTQPVVMLEKKNNLARTDPKEDSDDQPNADEEDKCSISEGDYEVNSPNKCNQAKRKDSESDETEEAIVKKLKMENEEPIKQNVDGNHHILESSITKDESPVKEQINDENELPALPQFTDDVAPYLNGEPLTLDEKKRMRESLIEQMINYLDGNQLLVSPSKGKQVWGYRLIGKAMLRSYPTMVQEYSMGKSQKRHPIGFFISKLAERRRYIRKKMQLSAAQRTPASEEQISSTDAGS